ncbi:amino acid ABC transporter permease [Companilactobacillus sp.]|jgi:cystine transport system permease protein|uniref:amino acid ABC transporter permease n=1 Tax=Companilactobacillus sp. TaxID=2767905 RepID=UPI0025BBB2C5|nr:amino acid ABC transporter permease [Companilactobacillus sp.]MCH4009920.1 amino acid ABC transporter permease [Companilactobacillus sp.]MCH4052404.1 amino acid ABC transporter permease [Companilactobacillus sp.]MCH4077862.1 amino acid ABC transporter permease [Companilactobacillus sp.]MCH4126438.1 amino acid ABC transporter permease [Companilactobacillus sp.]MCH4132024.1 amino acid ABC transporter permease [Companilactobacillus sp.]
MLWLQYLSIPDFFNAPLAVSSIPKILLGFPMSLILTVISFLLANILGFFLTLAQLSKRRWLRWPARVYISFMRGVPMLVVLFIIYFGFGAEALPAAIISFTIICSAFVSEVFRSSFSAVDIGQWEGGFSVGMNYRQVVRHIIFPQAFRISIPALGNILLDLFKGTSLAAMITVTEMFMQAKIIAGANQDYMTIYITIAFVYWFFCWMMTIAQTTLENKLKLD